MTDLNPYTSPAAQAEPTGEYNTVPWEQSGPRLSRYWQTLTLAYRGRLFTTMRPDGPYLTALAFCVLAAQAVTVIMALAVALFVVDFADVSKLWLEVLLYVFGAYLLGTGVSACLTFVFTLAVHLVLRTLGAVSCSLRGTFRVISYSLGCALYVWLIPFVGILLVPVVQLVLTYQGLRRIHQLPRWRAATAALLQFVLCASLLLVSSFWLHASRIPEQ